MKVAIPREIKNNEFRVAITPAGVHDLVGERPRGVRRDRRRASARRSPTRHTSSAGATHPPGCRRAPGRSPSCSSRSRSRSSPSTATSAPTWCSSPTCTSPPSETLTRALLASGVTAIAYETVQLPNRALPLLAPMSEVAGRLAPIVGREHDAEAQRRTRPARARRARNASGHRHRARRRRRRHQRDQCRRRPRRRGDRARHQHRRGCASSTPCTRAASRPSPRTASRSTRRSSPPTWSSGRCWCRARRRRSWSATSWSRG